jgi:hypothetical protein
MSARRIAASVSSSSPGLLPTPRTGDNRNSRVALTGSNSDRHGRTPAGSASGLGLEQAIEAAQGLTPRELLPTPSASRFNDGESLESWQARNERLRELGINGNGMGTPLPIAVQLLPTPLVTNRAGMEPSPAVGALLKTPTAQLAVNGGSQHPDKRRAGGHGPTLADQVEHALLPTPDATHGRKTTRTGLLLPGVVESLLPTPRATDGTKGGPNQRGSSGDLMLPSAASGDLMLPSAVLSLGASPLLPTPMAADGDRASLVMPRGNPTLIGALLPTPQASDGRAGAESATGGERPSGAKRSVKIATAVTRSPGASTSPLSGAGNESSGGQRQAQLSLDGLDSD